MNNDYTHTDSGEGLKVPLGVLPDLCSVLTTSLGFLPTGASSYPSFPFQLNGHVITVGVSTGTQKAYAPKNLAREYGINLGQGRAVPLPFGLSGSKIEQVANPLHGYPGLQFKEFPFDIIFIDGLPVYYPMVVGRDFLRHLGNLFFYVKPENREEWRFIVNCDIGKRIEECFQKRKGFDC